MRNHREMSEERCGGVEKWKIIEIHAFDCSIDDAIIKRT